VAAWTQASPENPEPAGPGVSDWSRVRDLANGDKIDIAVGGRHAVPCLFGGATKDYLFCDSIFSERNFRFDRAEVENVRMEQKKKNMNIVIGTMAAAGFAWGVAAPTSNEVHNGSPRVLNGLAGAAIGTLAGFVVAVPASVLMPGRLVYRQPLHEYKSQSNPFSTSAPPATAPAR
jgi:hypothetical protein